MASSYDVLAQSILRSRQDNESAQAAALASKTEEKRKRIDPNYEVFNPDLYEILDADTVRHKRTGENIRIQNKEGNSLDSFESDEARYMGTEKNRTRAIHHKKAYAQQYGMRAEDVSIQDMVEKGQIQKGRLQQNIEKLRGVGMQRTGADKYGRTLSQFDNYEAFGDASTIEGNAGYNLPGNYAARARDIASGELGERARPPERTLKRALLGDAAVNVTVGAARMASSLAEAGSVILGTSRIDGVDELFESARKGLDSFKEATASDAQQFREQMDAKRQALTPELFNLRKQKYLDAGKSEAVAKVYAGADEYKDKVEYLKNNPGRILDAALESLPYMIGVGAVGRVALKGATARLGKGVAKEIKAAGGSQAQAALSIEKYLGSKQGQNILKRASENIGMTTVGLTEGLSTAADVYASVANMTEEEAQQSEAYKKLVESGYSHKEATQELANEAFNQSFGAMTLLAAAAARGTGAGGFESRLFSGVVRPKVKAPKVAPTTKVAAKAVTKKAAVAGALKKVAKPVGRAALAVSKPGAKEFVEESIQSGGGEFLSQLAEFKATGKEVGPGIGGATAEGGIVGFVSGIGASTVTDSLKAVGRAATKKRGNLSGLSEKLKTSTPTHTPRTAPVAPAPAAPGQPVQVGASVSQAIKEVGEAYEKSDTPLAETMADITRLEGLRDIMLANGEQLSKEDEIKYGALMGLRQAVMADWMSVLADKDPKDLTENDRKLMQEAARLGVVTETNMQELPEEEHETLKSVIAINKVQIDSNKHIEKAVADAHDSPTGKTILQVFNEKFGDVGGKKPGLGWFRREMMTAATEGKSGKERLSAFTALSKRLNNFIATQQRQAKAYAEVARTGESTKKIKYKQGITEGIAQRLEDEAALMQRTAEALVNYYTAWNSYDLSQKAGEKLMNAALAGLDEAPVPQSSQESPSAEQEETPSATIPKVEKSQQKATQTVEKRERTANAQAKQVKRVNTAKAAAKAAKTAERAADEVWQDDATDSNLQLKLEAELAFEEATALAEKEEFIRDKMRGESFNVKGDRKLKPVTRQTALKKYNEFISASRKIGADLALFRAEKLKAELAEETLKSSDEKDVVDDTTQAQPEVVEDTAQEASEDTTQEAIIDTAENPSEEEVIQRVVQLVTLLNEETNVPAIGISEHWQNFLENTAANWARLKGQWIWGSKRPLTEADFEAFSEQTESKFKKAKLPTSLEDAFSRKNQTTNTLFAAMPDVMAVLSTESGRQAVLDALNLSEGDVKALDAYIKYYGEFKSTLEKHYRQLDLKKSFADVQMQEHAIHFFENDLGELDPNLIAVMALEAMVWIAGGAQGTVTNDDETINRMLGRPVSTLVTADEKAVLGTIGTIRNNVTKDLGRNIWRHMNLVKKVNPDVNDMFMDKLIVTLGGTALSVLANQDRAELTSVDTDWWFNAKATTSNSVNTFVEDEGVKINFARSRQTYNAETQMWEDNSADLIEAMEGSTGVFTRLFGVQSVVQAPVTEKPTKIKDGIERSVASIPARMVKRMLRSAQRSWRAETPLLNIVQKWDARTFLQLGHEYVKEEDMHKLHILDRKAAEGKNRGLERDYSSAMKWHREQGETVFYFTLRMIRSGRVYINSNTINPQASKMHRFMFGMGRWEVDVNTNPTTAKGIKRVEDMKIAIALGLGLNADKLLRQEVLDRVDEILASEDMKNALEVLNSDTVKYTTEQMATLAKMFEKGEGTHSLAALVAWNTYLNATGDTVKISLPMETDGITNGFIAGLLQTPPAILTQKYLDMLRAGGIFFKDDPWSNFPQYIKEGNKDNYQQIGMGVAGTLKAMADGSFFTGKTPEGELGFRDRYLREQADRVTNSGLLPNVEELQEKPGRDWSKTPLMVVAYGASIFSVIRAMQSKALDKWHGRLAEAGQAENPAEAIAAVINQAHEIANATLAANRKVGNGFDGHLQPGTTEDGSSNGLWYGVTAADVIRMSKRKEYGGDLQKFATEYTMDDVALSLFNTGIAKTYGTALEGALNDKLAPINEIRAQLNHANKLMNMIFVKDFLRRINTEQDTRGITLGPADRRAIYDQMIKEGVLPTVQMPFSTGTTDSLETTNYATDYVSGKDGVGETKFNEALQIIDRAYEGLEGKENQSPKAQAAILNRVISDLPTHDVGVAGVVKLIHALDGTNNSAAWGTDTEAWDVLNVHDAQISPFHLADEIAGHTTSDFLSMHAGYSLGSEILKSVSRMMALLLDETDPRLSKADKANIQKEFVNHLIEFGYMEERPKKDPLSDEQYIDTWYSDLQRTVEASNATRKRLFKGITWGNQFAKEGAEVRNPVNEEDVGGTIESLTAKLSPIEILRGFRDQLLNRSSAAERNLIEQIKEQLATGGDGLINHALLYYFQQNPNTSVADILSTLAAAYVDTPAGRSLQTLHNILQPHLGDTKFVVRHQPDNPATGEWAVRSNTIILNSAKMDRNWASVLFHEAVHAANYHRLLNMSVSHPALFEKMYVEAISWANAQRRARPRVKSDRYQIAQLIRQYGRGGANAQPAKAVTEYLAYATTTADKTSDTFELLNSKEIVDLLGSLFGSLQDPDTGAVLLHSTGRPVNRTLFEEKYDKLESGKMQQVFEDLKEHEQGPIDQEHQAELQALLNDFIIPGISSIETVMQQEIAEDPYGTEHVGEIEGNIIRLQAAGNKLSSNVDMSLQETALHEYSHFILKAAVGKGGDHWARKEAQRLWTIAKDFQTEQEWVTALMGPADKIVGDPVIAREKAQERYNHIFNNPKGENYHEFLAIALTNKAFATALQAIDNRVAAAPSSRGGFLNQVLEVLRRSVQWLSGQSLRTNTGSVHQGVYELAKATIAINQRNMQKIKDIEDGKDETNKLNRANSWVLQAIDNRIIEPLRAGFAASDKKRLDPKNPTTIGFIKAATYVALRGRDEATRKAYHEVYRAVGGTKDNIVAELFREVTPWNEENLGKEGSVGWMDLMRKSKVIIDMARQTMAQHTSSYLRKSFDKLNHLDEETKQAVTRVMMKTDLSALMEGDHSLTVQEVYNLIKNPAAADTLQQQLIAELQTELDKQGAGKLLHLFLNQSNSLANFMVEGKHTLELGMMNSHNIVNQFMLDAREVVSLDDKEMFRTLVDRITTLKAMAKTPPNDFRLALNMIDHEMARVDVGEDNGFSRLLGMLMNFKAVSDVELFQNGPVHKIKGYVYEIFDGDINIEVVDDTPAERQRMEQENMVEVGPVAKDKLDPNRRKRIMYKGLKGPAGYNKSIVSLTNMQHRGTNLFAVSGFDSQTALGNFSDMRRDALRAARKNQFKPGYVSGGEHMVAVLDDQGNITDFRYMMSEAVKQKVLKKKDPFDKVLPRMFASVKDRVNSKTINENVADLLYKEYRDLRNSKEHRFVQIGRYAMKIDKETGNKVPDKAARDMWHLLPKPMQDQLKESFGSEQFYIRDDVTNLVLGFRKMSISNAKLWGKNAPIVKMAEKHWQEVVQLERIKIAVLTPAVVVGNVASNTAMLLSEGIRPSYIRRKGAEAISAMRTYQKDVRRADELEHEIGSDRALKLSVRVKINELTRLRADIAANPVGQLVQEGLFTSIAEDIGAGDDTMHDNFIARTVEKGRTKGVPSPLVTAVQEAYMLPGSRGYRAGVAATQYGDFVARYIKFTYDTEVRKLDKQDAINKSLAAFIYYDLPQHKGLQYLNDTGFLMFTKFFMRIQPIIARMYTQNPISAFSVLAVQSHLMVDPFNENIMNYGAGDGLLSKPTLNPVGKAWDTLRPDEPALLQWILNPFGL